AEKTWMRGIGQIEERNGGTIGFNPEREQSVAQRLQECGPAGDLELPCDCGVRRVGKVYQPQRVQSVLHMECNHIRAVAVEARGIQLLVDPSHQTTQFDRRYAVAATQVE